MEVELSTQVEFQDCMQSQYQFGKTIYHDICDSTVVGSLSWGIMDWMIFMFVFIALCFFVYMVVKIIKA